MPGQLLSKTLPTPQKQQQMKLELPDFKQENKVGLK